jgi:hypothetical protein
LSLLRRQVATLKVLQKFLLSPVVVVAVQVIL